MPCIKAQYKNDTAYICIPDVYRIQAGDQVFLFEYHKFCGPQIIDQAGELVPMPAEEDHPFWNALTKWIQGGMQAGRDDSGVWDCIL